MVNYYEVLEVSQNASKEVIDRAYKVLAKKYHPDLQQPNQRKSAEEKLKKINEAYEILSDEFKRKQYDEKLSREINIQNTKILDETKEDYDKVYKERESLKKQLQYERQHKNATNNATVSNEEIVRRVMRNLNSRQQRVYNKQKFIRDKIAWLLTFVFIIVIGFIFWKIPYTHNKLVKIYNENEAVKILTNIIVAIVSAFGKALTGMFKN